MHIKYEDYEPMRWKGGYDFGQMLDDVRGSSFTDDQAGREAFIRKLDELGRLHHDEMHALLQRIKRMKRALDDYKRVVGHMSRESSSW